MKLKERTPFQSGVFLDEIVTPPPTFDIDRAKEANRFSFQFLYGRINASKWERFAALRLAVALSFYNFTFYTDHIDSKTSASLQKILQKRLDHLTEKEKRCADIHNPLPTIGIEVEIPRKPYQTIEQRQNKYTYFFEHFLLSERTEYLVIMYGNFPLLLPMLLLLKHEYSLNLLKADLLQVLFHLKNRKTLKLI